MTETVDNIFLNNKTQFFDEKIESYIDINFTNISRNFNEVYILLKKDDDKIPIEFYGKYIPINIFEKTINKLSLYRVNINILKNTKHINNISILSKNQIEKFNHNNYKLNDKNIVLSILNINYNKLLPYLSQFEIKDNLINLYNIFIINIYFDCTSNNINDNMFIMEDINYWNNKIDFSKYLENRKFKINVNRLDDKYLAKIIKNKIIYKKYTNNNEDNCDYLKDITSYNDYKIALDNIKNNYNVDTYNTFSKQDINNLFDNLNPKQKFIFFINMLVSKKYCHLVINSHILSYMKNIINNNKDIFNYLFSYTWFRFYIDEIITNKYIKTSDDMIIDINTASELPIFDYSNIFGNNAYLPIFGNNIDKINNVHGMKYYPNLQQGICNLSEFKTRLNIFITGLEKFDIFEGYDFDKNNMAISGSVMTACLQKKHVLMNIIKDDIIAQGFEKHYNEYFDTYYRDSDVDIMFKTKDIFTFIDNVNTLFKHIKSININNNVVNDTQLILKKVNKLFISEKFIIDNIKIDYFDKYNILKFIYPNINSEPIKAIFRDYYIIEYNKYLDNILSNFDVNGRENIKLQYPEIFNISNDYNIYITSKTDNISIDITYKYNIISSFLKRKLELFQIMGDDFFSIISTFHLPNVRAYYNGNNAYLLPSCVSAHLTYMNIDYKYFFGSKDPIEIIIKNRKRGFGTFLNNIEKDMYYGYNKFCTKLELYNSLNPIELNNSIVANYTNIKSEDELKKILIEMKPPVNNNLEEMNAILKVGIKSLEYGNIIPVKSWILNFLIDLFDKLKC
jgi:hypothetical protein